MIRSQVRNNFLRTTSLEDRLKYNKWQNLVKAAENNEKIIL